MPIEGCKSEDCPGDEKADMKCVRFILGTCGLQWRWIEPKEDEDPSPQDEP